MLFFKPMRVKKRYRHYNCLEVDRIHIERVHVEKVIYRNADKLCRHNGMNIHRKKCPESPRGILLFFLVQAERMSFV